MIRRDFVLISLAAFAALAVLTACETGPMASPGSPDPGMTAAAPATGGVTALSHGGGNGNGGNGNNGNGNNGNNGNNNDDNDNDGGNGHDGGNNGQATCPAVGARVEIEGTIAGKTATTLTVHQQGRKNFLCQVNSLTSIRKGNKPYTLAQLQNGWRVHVKGDVVAAISVSNLTCTAKARQIMVQNTTTH